jgi:adenosine deaminase
MNFQDLPKVELHLHLDCSLSYAVVKQLKPSITPEEYQKSFIAPPKCVDLADYISRASKGFELMQTEAQLRLVVYDLFDQLKADNVIYAEIRFAPFLHILGGLSPNRVVEIINETIEECIHKYEIEAGIILCTLRHFSEAKSLDTVKLVEQFQGTRVIGFDIAGDESGYNIQNHLKAFQFAIQNGIKCTAHAGEAMGAESVWETIKNFKTNRIGHGVRSVEDERLISFLKDKNIHLEVCPTSNIQVGVFDKIENHPIDDFFRSGISVSINTDGRTISNVTLADEYRLLNRVFSWGKNHFKQCNLSAIEHSFASETIKNKLKEEIEKAY